MGRGSRHNIGSRQADRAIGHIPPCNYGAGQCVNRTYERIQIKRAAAFPRATRQYPQEQLLPPEYPVADGQANICGNIAASDKADLILAIRPPLPCQKAHKIRVIAKKERFSVPRSVTAYTPPAIKRRSLAKIGAPCQFTLDRTKMHWKRCRPCWNYYGPAPVHVSWRQENIPISKSIAFQDKQPQRPSFRFFRDQRPVSKKSPG